MAGRQGSAPGERRGGRKAGTPNKKTIIAMEEQRLAEIAKTAERERVAKERAHIPLGKDVLEDYMQAFAGIAAIYQNKLLAEYQQTQTMTAATLNEFERWGSLTATTAKALADFQSPKFKAIMVSVPGDQNRQPEPKTIDGAKVIEINDPVAVARVYTNMVKSARKR